MKTVRLGWVTCICALLILTPSLLTAGDATKQLSATIDGFVPIVSNTPRAELHRRTDCLRTRVNWFSRVSILLR